MKYIVTYVCGDTVNIPTYDVIQCESDKLIETLDKNYGRNYGWRNNQFYKIYEVSEIDKYDLIVGEEE